MGNFLIPKEIVTVSWSWTNDEGQLQKNKLNNVLYFTDSPVNILSTTILAEFMKVYEWTWVLTKGKYHIFSWDSGKYKKTIAHSKNVFCKRVLSISGYYAFNFSFTSITIQEGPRTVNPIDFISEDEDKIIR